MSFFNIEIQNYIMDQAVHRYIEGKYTSVLLSKTMNGVFEVKSRDKEFIIRFSNPLKSHKHIYAEMEFIHFLWNKGQNVTKPIISKENNMVECVVDGNCTYIVTAFEKAKGKIVDASNKDEWNDTLFYNWGLTMGKLHRETKNFIPSNEEYKRCEWNEECINAEVSIFSPDLELPLAESIVLNKWKELLNELAKLSKDKNSYGLVHGDLHALNFFVDNDKLTVFDFDDCSYNWFAYDIAVSFYDCLYNIPFNQKQKRIEFLKHFSDKFFDGYSRENTLSNYWINQIPLFMKYRDYLLYIVTVKYSDINQMDIGQRKILECIRRNLENNVPIVDSFESILL